ncbi:hypothetical protein DPX16_7073 [Anabarilius grahami]|uniref:Uncharacterized protein n=1 Tax=Anabarilius grahami TaxID=495550 RepID=A0A3N0Y1P3_ANAGA|nr:hypothetical protein DPX16_7073 [Anabarilius grahami]
MINRHRLASSASSERAGVRDRLGAGWLGLEGSWGIDTHGPEQITSEHITTEDHLALSNRRTRTHTGTVKRISLYSLHIPLPEECGEESYLLGTLKRLRLLAG